MKRKTKKLTLRIETLKDLQLTAVVGGRGITTTDCPTTKCPTTVCPIMG